MDARQRYDAKRPLLSFRLSRDDVDRFDAWRGELTRSQGAARLVSEGLRTGLEPDLQPPAGEVLLPCELELVAELGAGPELARDLGIAFHALRGADVPRGSTRYLKGMRAAIREAKEG
jgi:hypothetical protein